MSDVTVESLVQVLTALVDDEEAIDDFFLCYRYQWSSPTDVFAAVKELPANPSKPNQWQHVVQEWLFRFYHRDFRDDPLLLSMACAYSQIDEATVVGGAMEPVMPPEKPPMPESVPAINVMSQWSSKAIADTITGILHPSWKTLPINELLFGQPRKRTVFAHLMDQYRVLSAWSAELVTNSGVEMIKKLLKISQQLFKMNNYHSLFAIVAGLNSAPVQALKDVWSRLPPKYSQQYNRYSALMNPSHDYQAYVNATQGVAVGVDPTLPYLMYLTRTLARIREKAMLNSDRLSLETLKKTREFLNFIRKSQAVSPQSTLDETLRAYFANLRYIVSEFEETEEGQSSIESAAEGDSMMQELAEQKQDILDDGPATVAEFVQSRASVPKEQPKVQEEEAVVVVVEPITTEKDEEGEQEEEEDPAVEPLDPAVAAFLEENDLTQYAEVFAENRVDFQMLQSITSNELTRIGISKMGHRKRIIRKLGASSPPPPAKLPEPSPRLTSNDLPPPAVAPVAELDIASMLVSPRARSVPKEKLANVSVFVKAKMDHVTRVIKVPRSVSIQNLEKQIRVEFDGAKIQLKFKDWEGDLIDLNSRVDLEYAMMHTKGSALSLFCVRR